MTVGPYRTLDLCFDVATDDPALTQRIDALFARCRTSRGEAAHALRATHDPAHGWRVTFDDEVLLAGGPETLVVPTVVWAVNRRAVRSVTRTVLVHAGAVGRDGRAALLVGASGAGKSTLVAHLVAAGFDYLTDEAVPFTPETGTVEPYPKPLKLEPGSFALVPAAAPADPGADGEHGWYVPPDRLAPDDPATSVGPAYVRAVLAIGHGAPATTFEPATRARMLVLVAEQSFNVETLGATGFTALCRLVAQSTCARLAVADLAPVGALVDEVLRAAPVRPADVSCTVTAEPAAAHGPAPRAGLLVARLDGEAVVYDRDGRRVHHLDAAGRAVWDAADGTRTVAEVADALAHRYSAPAATVRADVEATLADLERVELLRGG